MTRHRAPHTSPTAERHRSHPTAVPPRPSDAPGPPVGSPHGTSTEHATPAAEAPSAGPLHFGYGTNGLADLRLDDALALLADLGYAGVGLTLDHMHLDPYAPDLAARTARLARRLDALGLDVTVETVPPPRRGHGHSILRTRPTLRRSLRHP